MENMGAGKMAKGLSSMKGAMSKSKSGLQAKEGEEMDGTTARQFLGECWMHPLPFFAMDPSGVPLALPFLDWDQSVPQRRDGGGEGDIPLGYIEASTREPAEKR